MKTAFDESKLSRFGKRVLLYLMFYVSSPCGGEYTNWREHQTAIQLQFIQ